jgi:hypothetical protein
MTSKIDCRILQWAYKDIKHKEVIIICNLRGNIYEGDLQVQDGYKYNKDIYVLRHYNKKVK